MKKIRLPAAIRALDRRYFEDWDKLSQRERDAWNVVRLVAEAEVVRRRRRA